MGSAQGGAHRPGRDRVAVTLKDGTRFRITRAACGFVMEAARTSGAEFLPLDSELSAIHQCLRGNSEKSVERIILTASGGPFRTRPAGTFDTITVEDALDHPVWDMGPKVTVDSATLMNKGLEILETHRVFDVPIEISAMPESICALGCSPRNRTPSIVTISGATPRISG